MSDVISDEKKKQVTYQHNHSFESIRMPNTNECYVLL